MYLMYRSTKPMASSHREIFRNLVFADFAETTRALIPGVTKSMTLSGNRFRPALSFTESSRKFIEALTLLDYACSPNRNNIRK